jgi:hypothetical protein
MRVATVQHQAGTLTAVVAVPAALSQLTLPTSAFTISRGGTRVPAAVQQLPNDTLSVTLVIDASQSVTPAQLRLLQSAAVELVLRLPSQTRYTIIAAGDGARVVGDTQATPVAALGNVAEVTPGGAPSLDAAVAQAAGEALSMYRNAVVVLSAEPSSITTPISTLAGRSLVYGVPLGTPPAGLAPLATATGGLVTPNTDMPVAAVDAIAADLLGQYRIQMPDGPGAVTVSVQANGVSAATTVPALASAQVAAPGIASSTAATPGGKTATVPSPAAATSGKSSGPSPPAAVSLALVAVAAVLFIVAQVLAWRGRNSTLPTAGEYTDLVEPPSIPTPVTASLPSAVDGAVQAVELAEPVTDEDITIRVIQQVALTGTTVGDVRRWLAAVRAAGIPDSAPLDPAVQLHVVDRPGVRR